MTWIHEQVEWPNFYWQLTKDDYILLLEAKYQQRLLSQKLQDMGISLQKRILVENLACEILSSNSIEGEKLPEDEIRRSLERQLGLIDDRSTNHFIDGIVAIMLDAIYNHEDLNHERLFGWHAALFPTGYSGLRKITVADWRKGDMQIVSGPEEHIRVHYVAPEANRIPQEMSAFFAWLANTKDIDPVIMSGIAHLRFVLIHPLSDGNGRIARTLSDAILAQAEDPLLHFYSFSQEYKNNCDEYYKLLDSIDTLDCTTWIQYQIRMFAQAIQTAETKIATVFRDRIILENAKKAGLNQQQKKILQKLLHNFRGKLSVEKYCKIAKCSKDCAILELQQMVQYHILEENDKKGYILCEPEHTAVEAIAPK